MDPKGQKRRAGARRERHQGGPHDWRRSPLAVALRAFWLVAATALGGGGTWYNVGAGTTRQVTQTVASEYSATPLPSGEGFSSIHESADGQLIQTVSPETPSTSTISTRPRARR